MASLTSQHYQYCIMPAVCNYAYPSMRNQVAQGLHLCSIKLDLRDTKQVKMQQSALII